MVKINLCGYDLLMSQEKYLNNGTPAITLFIKEDGDIELFLDVTKNLRDAELQLGDGECMVKTWSENESFITPLLESGYFEDTSKRVQSGFAELQIWKILKPISGDEIIE